MADVNTHEHRSSIKHYKNKKYQRHMILINRCKEQKCNKPKSTTSKDKFLKKQYNK